MKRLLGALLISLLCVSSAVAQLAISPEGAVLPDGTFNYTLPVSIPLLPSYRPEYLCFPVTPLYPISFPKVPVPIPPPDGSTSDRIRSGDYGRPLSDATEFPEEKPPTRRSELGYYPSPQDQRGSRTSFPQRVDRAPRVGDPGYSVR
jgi:hypothetical protein